MFLASKKKHCLTINKYGVIDEHKDFKGFTNVSDNLNRKEKFKMFEGDKLVAKVPLNWKKLFSQGVVIPHRMRNCNKCSKDQLSDSCDILLNQRKEFSANLNELKREKPNDFGHMHLFRPNEHNEDYHTRKPNDENFLFEIGDNMYIYVGERVLTFETNAKKVKCSSEICFIDVKFPHAYGNENIYFMLHQKYIPTQEYEKTTVKNAYQYLYKKHDELKSDKTSVENEGIVEYGNDFQIVKLFTPNKKKREKPNDQGHMLPKYINT